MQNILHEGLGLAGVVGGQLLPGGEGACDEIVLHCVVKARKLLGLLVVAKQTAVELARCERHGGGQGKQAGQVAERMDESFQVWFRFLNK